MSAALPQTISPNNPIDDQAVVDTLAELGVKLPDAEVPEYANFLKGVWEIWNKIDAADDYVPPVDLERFPRENVHRPSGEENKTNGWAWKVTIEDKQGKGGLLAGKTVCLKVSLGPWWADGRTTSRSRTCRRCWGPTSSASGRPTRTRRS
jgi:amidase